MNKTVTFIVCLFATPISVHALEATTSAVTAPATQSNVLSENTSGAVSPNDAATLLSDKQAVMIDVRGEDEWKQQHIPGTVNIPLDQLMGRLSELNQYKEKPIITQCQRGVRSEQAATVLKSLGFTKVYNLEGGIEAWNKAGLKTQ